VVLNDLQAKPPASPLFSIIMPTRNRAELARSSIERILRQPFGDFELIVLENSDAPELDGRFSDRRVTVLPSPRTLSMPANWERGLDVANGQYLLYLSDKDWLTQSALSDLAEVTRTTVPTILTYRKSCWFPDRGLLTQHDTGRVTTLLSEPVLQSWFSGVTHLHHAPMVYNSVVSRSFLSSLLKREKFFVGNSPDVASSILMLSAVESFTLFDRVCVMGLFGEWSIGMATRDQGRKAAAARFAAEFGDDPVAREGLVWSITGVIAETLLSCQRVEPERLSRFRINWTEYLKATWQELDRRERAGEDTTTERELLRAGVDKIYSRVVWRKAARSFGLQQATAWWQAATVNLRVTAPTKFFFPPHERLERLLKRPAPTLADPGTSIQDRDCFLPGFIPAPDPHDGLQAIDRRRSEQQKSV
jgi:hypothetical protein